MVRAAQAYQHQPVERSERAAEDLVQEQPVAAPPYTDHDAFAAMSVGMLLGVPLFIVSGLALFGYTAWAAGLNAGAAAVSTLGGGLLMGMYLGGLLGMGALVKDRTGH